MTITGCTRQARVRAAQNQDLYEHYMDEGDEKQQIETKLIIGATSYNIFNSNAPLTQNTDQQKEQLTDTVSTHLLNEFDQFVLYWFMSSQYLVFYNNEGRSSGSKINIEKQAPRVNLVVYQKLQSSFQEWYQQQGRSWK